MGSNTMVVAVRLRCVILRPHPVAATFFGMLGAVTNRLALSLLMSSVTILILLDAKKRSISCRESRGL